MRGEFRSLRGVSLAAACLAVVVVGARGQVANHGGSGELSSRIIRTSAGERILIQEITIEAPRAAVWESYGTADGWMAWAAPLAEVDLRAGGTIRTHYTPGASIGDPGTNVLHIVNYVPERVLTLQAEVQQNWPDIMKEDAENLMNVVVFEAQGANRTRVMSYGVGYRDTPAYEELLAFFVPANEGLYMNLKAYLEDGKRTQFERH